MSVLLGSPTGRCGKRPAIISRAAESLLQFDRPLVVAHRGFSSIAPENTLEAFRKAVAAGADLVELDFRQTKDGKLVVIHDATLARTTDAKDRWGSSRLKVSSFPLDRLQELEAGSWFDPPHPGLHLPSLGEALDIICRRSVALIEHKSGDAVTAIKLIRRKRLLNRVMVQSFDWDFLRDYHAQEPDQLLAALGPPGSRRGQKLAKCEQRLNAEYCDEIHDLGARVVVWNNQLNRASIRAAQKRGLNVLVYTINDPQTANDLLNLGADGVISNIPTMIQSVLADRAAKLG